MSDIFYSKNEQEVSDFIFENYNKNNPIEIVGQSSKKNWQNNSNFPIFVTKKHVRYFGVFS